MPLLELPHDIFYIIHSFLATVPIYSTENLRILKYYEIPCSDYIDWISLLQTTKFFQTLYKESAYWALNSDKSILFIKDHVFRNYLAKVRLI